MALHRELLDQADHLLTGPLGQGAGPSDADIRRAISNAYYAIFHLLVQESTDLLCPANLPALAARFRRGFNHFEMKRVCGGIARANGRPSNMPEPLDSLFQQPLNTAIVALASAFCNLQLSRHVADYDTSNAIGLGVAQTSVVSARAVILGWQSVRNTDDAKIFLTALPMHRNWADRR